eukprot:GDKI01033885.1.p1 GENE.GDKI01033885.1~~GDKI01033885.1.p1  ORF type:complete len:290 (+),score=74.29 GDKI01033885.1:106-975(+)
MTRHSKNSTANAVFTYAERSKMESGSIKARLGADSMRKFESCWLCLRPSVKPVCTPQGYIYCHQCIILNAGEQKKQMAEDMEKWEAQKAKQEKEEQTKLLQEKSKDIADFLQANEGVAGNKGWAGSGNGNGNGSQTAAGGAGSKKIEFAERKSKLEETKSNFWLSEQAPKADPKAVKEPRKHLICPISGNPLKLKELTHLKPETTTDNTETTRWICPISKKMITHQKAAALKETGQVFLTECLEKYVMGKKGYLGDKEVTSKDIIHLIPGGTGFSAHNKVEAESYRPDM